MNIDREALAIYCETFANSYRYNAVLIKLVSRWDLFDMAAAIMTADAEWQMGIRQAPMAMGELKRSLRISPRSVQVLVPILSFYGLVKVCANPEDKRISWIHPLPKLEGPFLVWLLAALSFIDACSPEQPPLSALTKETNALQMFKAHAGRDYLNGALPWDQHELIRYFAQRDAGFQLLCSLMVSHYRNTPFNSVSSFRSLFGVSRSHLHNMLKQAKKEKWLEYDKDRRVYLCTLRMIESFETFVLAEAHFLKRHARSTLMILTKAQ